MKIILLYQYPKWRKLLCAIGLHKWAYVGNERRHYILIRYYECECCPAKKQRKAWIKR